MILSCNHPNSFLDAISVALLIKRPVHFLARSDVFRKPFARWILHKLKMIPIYRLQEGMENIEKNKGTFKLCNEILSKGEVLLIFSEGNCVLEKRLRPLKKGTARIAFGAAEFCNWKKEIQIIPVGINYAEPVRFRTELMLSFGKKIDWIDLKDVWMKEQARSIKLFNERVYPKLKENLLIIPSHEKDHVGECILKLGRNLFHHKIFSFSFIHSNRLKIEQSWLQKIFSENDEKTEDGFKRFEKACHKAGIPLESARSRLSFSNIFFLVIAFAPALAGIFVHLLPGWLANTLTNRTVKSAKFKSSVLFGAGALLTYFFYVILGIIMWIINFRLLPILILLPFLALISLLWIEQLQGYRWSIQHRIFQKKHSDVYQQWKTERDQLFGLLQSSQ